MLKRFVLFILLICASCVIRPQMTREQYREQEEIIGSVRIIRAQMREIGRAHV